MAKTGASVLNLYKMMRSTGKAIYAAEPTMVGHGIEEYLISKAKNWKEYKEMWDEEAKKWRDGLSAAPTIRDGGGGLEKEENVFCMAKNCKEATKIWEEEAKKWKEEASENWEEAAEKFEVAFGQLQESAENWDDKDMTDSEDAALEEYGARIWEEEAKGWGLALKGAQAASKAWEENAKHWEKKANKWQEKAVKWALGGDPPQE